jgi:hypothetical protein
MKRVRTDDPDKFDQYVQHTRIKLQEKFEIFHQVCMEFHFMNKELGQDDPDSLIFVKRDRIFSLNFETEKIDTIMKFQDDLVLQPEYFCMA